MTADTSMSPTTPAPDRHWAGARGVVGVMAVPASAAPEPQGGCADVPPSSPLPRGGVGTAPTTIDDLRLRQYLGGLAGDERRQLIVALAHALLLPRCTAGTSTRPPRPGEGVSEVTRPARPEPATPTHLRDADTSGPGPAP